MEFFACAALELLDLLPPARDTTHSDDHGSDPTEEVMLIQGWMQTRDDESKPWQRQFAVLTNRGMGAFPTEVDVSAPPSALPEPCSLLALSSECVSAYVCFIRLRCLTNTHISTVALWKLYQVAALLFDGIQPRQWQTLRVCGQPAALPRLNAGWRQLKL